MSSYLMPNVRKYSAVFSWGELTPEWKSVQVVTEPSERCTTVMSLEGRFTPAFKSAMALSFHLVILPR